MWVNEKNRIYEFTTISSLAEEDEEGNIKIVKDTVKGKLTTSLYNVEEVKSVITDSGRISKKYCKIKTNHDEHTILGNYNSIKELVYKDKERGRIGF